MRRAIIILVIGVVIAAVGYCSIYFMGTATPRALMRSPQPELAWLKHEFNLSDAEFKRVSELHDGYLPQCMERCRRIEALDSEFSNALGTASQLTPELEKLLQERAQVRAICQAEMLKHFFDVSRTMPPDQGKRYVSWVWENTCLRDQSMGHGPDNHVEKAASGHNP